MINISNVHLQHGYYEVLGKVSIHMYVCEREREQARVQGGAQGA